MNDAKYLINDAQRRSFASLRPIIEGRFYAMDYYADYMPDEAIDAGCIDIDDFNKFGRERLLDGGSMAAEMKGFGSGCSAFCGFAGAHTLFCRNYDYGHELIGLMLHITPPKGYRSINMCDLGFMDIKPGAFEDGKTDLSFLMLMPYLCVDGVNEKGLATATLMLSHRGVRQDTGKKRISTASGPRIVLDRAANVDEAIELLRQYDMHSTMKDCDFHFFMADARGVSKVIEYVNGEMRVLDARYVTNSYLTPYMGEVVENPRFDILRSFVTFRNSCFGRDEAMAALRCAHQDKDARAGGSYTRWSTVMDLNSRSMELCYDRDYDRKHIFTV